MGLPWIYSTGRDSDISPLIHTDRIYRISTDNRHVPVSPRPTHKTPPSHHFFAEIHISSKHAVKPTAFSQYTIKTCAVPRACRGCRPFWKIGMRDRFRHFSLSAVGMRLHLRCQITWRRLSLEKMHGIVRWTAWLRVNRTLPILNVLWNIKRLP